MFSGENMVRVGSKSAVAQPHRRTPHRNETSAGPKKERQEP